MAFESSCDDTCVALLERISPSIPIRVVAEARETLDSAQAGGVIPVDAVHFHQRHVARLAARVCALGGSGPAVPPDLICATRGPGMVGSLSSTLQFAKGLALAWNRPLVGVHHMLGHLLAGTLVESAENGQQTTVYTRPQYPFLSLLCSGGHTMLVLLTALDKHQILVDTIDIAAGDALDKSARCLGLRGNMIGPELEALVEGISETRKRVFRAVRTDGTNAQFPLKMSKPMTSAKHRRMPDTVAFSFASFSSCVDAFTRNRAVVGDLRDFTAFKIQEMIFDHILDRVNVALAKNAGTGVLDHVRDFVCSGGVAANKVLRHKLRSNLSRLFTFHFPLRALCTDNAAMIGNAGMEIFEKLRLQSSLEVLPMRKWPMESLMDVDGWEPVSDREYRRVTGF